MQSAVLITFVGPTQGHIRSLGRRLGVDEFPTYDEGDNVYTVDGTRLTYSDTSPAGIAIRLRVLLRGQREGWFAEPDAFAA